MIIPTHQTGKGTITTAQDTITNTKDTSPSILMAVWDICNFHGHRELFPPWLTLSSVSIGALVRMMMWVESPRPSRQPQSFFTQGFHHETNQTIFLSQYGL